MTMILILIAVAAGVASALMFASISSGALISIILFYLAPLPLMVAGLGWGPLTALIGAIAASLGVASIFGFAYVAAFAITVGLPAWWLSRMALLGRPAETPSPASGDIEWYPAGRLLLWIAVFAILTTLAALFALGTDSATINAMLKRGLMRVMGLTNEATITEDTHRVVDLLVDIAPAAGASIAMLTLTLNLWLSGKIAAMSGRLQRSWPNLHDIELPPMTLAVLSLAIAIGFMGGLFGMIAQIVTAALMTAYSLIGLATVHVLTSRSRSRILWRTMVYASIMVFGWPILLMIGLGLTDAIIGLRRRYHARHTQPPTLHT